MGHFTSAVRKGREASGHKYTSRKATGDTRHPWAYYYGTEEHSVPKGSDSTFAAQRGRGKEDDLFTDTGSAPSARDLVPMGARGARKLRAEIQRLVGVPAAQLKARTPKRAEIRRSGAEVKPRGKQWLEVGIADYEGLHKQAGVSRKDFERGALTKLKTKLAAAGYTFDEARFGKDSGRVLVGRFAEDKGKA